MKVLLLKDVAKVGHKGEVKDVANGYGQNFLIGRGLATLATPARIAAAQKTSELKEQKQQADKQMLLDGLKKLGDKPLIINASANEKDHLFEAVSAETIAAHMRDVMGVAVDAHAVVIDEPIKTLGEHTVHVALGSDSIAVNLSIESK